MALPGRIWILGAWPDEGESPRERYVKRQKAAALVDEHGIGGKKLEWYNECGWDLYRRVRDGDWFVEVWGATPRSRLGRLKGPYATLGAVDLGARFGPRRYCLSAYPVRRGDWRLARGDLAALLRVLGDRCAPDRAAEDPIRKPVLLNHRQHARLQSLLNSLVRARS